MLLPAALLLGRPVSKSPDHQFLGSTATETRASARVHPRNIRYPGTWEARCQKPERQRGCIPGMFATLILGKHVSEARVHTKNV